MKNLFLCVLSTLFISSQILAQECNCDYNLGPNDQVQQNSTNCVPEGVTLNNFNANGNSNGPPTIVCIYGNLSSNSLNVDQNVEIHNHSQTLQINGINMNGGKFVNHEKVTVNGNLIINGQLINKGTILATNAEIQVKDNSVFENIGNLDHAKKIIVEGSGEFINTGTATVTELIKVQNNENGQFNNEGTIIATNAQVEVENGIVDNNGNLDLVKRIAVKNKGKFINIGTTKVTEEIKVEINGEFLNSGTTDVTGGFITVQGNGSDQNTESDQGNGIFTSTNDNVIVNLDNVSTTNGGVFETGTAATGGNPEEETGGNPGGDPGTTDMNDDLWSVKLFPNLGDNKEFITTSKHLLVGDFAADGGGNANSMIVTRHVNGKDNNSNEYGELNLNWHGGDDVNIGNSADNGNKSDLNIYGSLFVDNNIQLYYDDPNEDDDVNEKAAIFSTASATDFGDILFRRRGIDQLLLKEGVSVFKSDIKAENIFLRDAAGQEINLREALDGATGENAANLLNKEAIPQV